MRKFATSRIVAFLFFGPLIASFAIWGINDIFRSTGSNTVFSVGSTNVPVEIFARDFHNAMRSSGTTLPPDQAKALGQQVLDRMMMVTALDNLTASLGLTASDARVAQTLHAMQAFTGPLGSFDHDKFLQIIGQAGYNEPEFISVSRNDSARSQMLRGVEGGFFMPQDYAGAIFGYINEIRAAEFVVVRPEMIGDIAPPSEAELAAYVKKHPERFSSPEYRDVSIASIGVDDVASTITVTDKQIEDEISGNRADYVVDERRELEQIGFKSETEAKAAKAELDGGKSFETIAFAHKLSAADYKLGDIAKADLAIDPARANAAFALPADGTTGPVKGNFGWVLIHVVKITPGTAKTHDEIKAIVQKKLALDRMATISNAFTDNLANGDSFADATRKAGMKFVHIAALDDQGLAPDGSKGIALTSPELLAAIFKAEVGEEGDPFASQDNHYFAIKVDGVTPPKVKPLDAVRAQAISRWIAEKRVEKMRAKAEALASKANKEHSLAAAAASIGAPLQSSPALNRGTNEGAFNRLLVEALFKAKAGETIALPTMDGGYVVARVSGVQHVPPDNNLTYLRGVAQLSGEIAQDITISMAKAEQARETVTINQKLVDSTVGNSGSGL